MSGDIIGTALLKCFYCGNDSDILMNTRLSETDANKVKELHGKCINMNPCTECTKYMEMGIIMITYDPEKSTDDMFYRTGGFFVIKDDAIKRWFDEKNYKEILEKRFVFIDHKLAEDIGLFEFAQED